MAVTRSNSKKANTKWIGRRIMTARQLRGWTSDELARRSGLGHRRIERFEATGDLTCDELGKLAAALRLPIDYFLAPVSAGGPKTGHHDQKSRP